MAVDTVTVGVIFIDTPVPEVVPPQEVVYQCQVAPVPREPPFSDSVTAVPEQTVEGDVEVIDVAAVDKVFKVTVSL